MKNVLIAALVVLILALSYEIIRGQDSDLDQELKKQVAVVDAMTSEFCNHALRYRNLYHLSLRGNDRVMQDSLKVILQKTSGRLERIETHFIKDAFSISNQEDEIYFQIKQIRDRIAQERNQIDAIVSSR